MLHKVYTELLVTYRVMSVPLLVSNLKKCQVFLGCACECPPTKLIPTGLLVRSAPHGSVLHILCSWHMSEVSTHTHTHAHTQPMYTHTHTHSHLTVLSCINIYLSTWASLPFLKVKISLIYFFFQHHQERHSLLTEDELSTLLRSSSNMQKKKKKKILCCSLQHML